MKVMLIQANIEVYQNGNLVSINSTDTQGNYEVNVKKSLYDIVFNFFEFWVKFPNLNLLTDLYEKIKEITFEPNRISLATDIKTGEIIQVHTGKPLRVYLNGSEIGNVSSLEKLKKNTWFYDSFNNTLYIKLDPYLKFDCIYECCMNEERYYDKPCEDPNYYCDNRQCVPKVECPFECCINETQYLDKLCASPFYCVERKCVEANAYWKFDEGSGNIAYDSSGLGNDGTIYGATWSTNCISGSCLSFDGVDDYVFVPNSSSLTISGEITIEAWVYPLGWNGKYPGIVAKYWPNGYLLGINNGSRTWNLWLRTEGGGLGIIWSDSPVELNKWIHLAVTRDSNGVMKMYINGTLQARTTTLKGSISEPERDLEIGRWDGYFKGLIDEVRIYSRALTEEEIRAHAQG